MAKALDWDNLSKLLAVIAGTREYPRLKAIHDLALGELEDMADELKTELEKVKANEATVAKPVPVPVVEPVVEEVDEGESSLSSKPEGRRW